MNKFEEMGFRALLIVKAYETVENDLATENAVESSCPIDDEYILIGIRGGKIYVIQKRDGSERADFIPEEDGSEAGDIIGYYVNLYVNR